ncbi:MGDG synthase family glycosyltransferase [Ornithinibacillus bavariensis]|uniref:Glycosyltransferase YkoN n=1 Tax=Ornithinibacillus bavariensis TaxID=545502 RepID=A0A920C6B2_9BACI|nr:glycosyltransferase [Ornithinibacillus bavariensis]GIO26413.1 putative glycosyltransferase YkoN [Ornithinibacillus bavariensis]
MLKFFVALVIEGIENMEIRQKENALFLPFLKLPTGHHHVADAVMKELQNTFQTLNCEKVDILSYSYGPIERLVSTAYISWIKIMPKAYDKLYQYLAVNNQTNRSRQLVYEVLFTSFFKRLMEKNQPRILFCTHSLPSNLASVLKQKNQLQATTVNVYTDFFVNRVWGISGIDYHLVPSIRMKNFLLELGVDESTIYVTGIPIHPIFKKTSQCLSRNKRLTVLITGGSLGMGAIEKLIPTKPTIHYIVLCGKNEKLYQRLQQKNDPLITPINYIENKEKMNGIYDQVDAVVTKPGGVTVSECLMKRKPIFTCSALPGQEKVNELELKELGVIYPIDIGLGNVESHIKDFFQNKEAKTLYEEAVNVFHRHLDKKSLPEILQEICL